MFGLFGTNVESKHERVNRIAKYAALDMVLDRNGAYKKAVTSGNKPYMYSTKNVDKVELLTDDTIDTTYIKLPATLLDKYDDDEEAVQYLTEIMKVSLGYKILLDKATGEEDETKRGKYALAQYSSYNGELDIKDDVLIDYGILKVPNPDIFDFHKHSDEEKKDKKEKTEEEKEDSKGECEETSESSKLTKSGAKSDNDKNEDKKGQESQTNIDFDTEIGKACSDGKPADIKHWFDEYGGNKFTSKEKEKLRKLAEQLSKSFVGFGSKVKKISPSKRMCSKAICNDISDKIYVSKKGAQGHKVNLNFMIDTSGSMGGKPIRNAVKIAFIFNHLAEKGLLNASIMYSESYKRLKLDLPVHEDLILKMSGTHGGEGLAATIEQYKDDLLKADINICITDGDITDGAIPKEKYRHEMMGVYVRNCEEVEKFTGSLSRWFHKSIVRSDINELINKLVNMTLSAKKVR